MGSDNWMSINNSVLKLIPKGLISIQCQICAKGTNYATLATFDTGFLIKIRGLVLLC